MITEEQIREKLRKAIKDSGISQKEIAKQISVHPSAVNKYMRDNTFPALDTFANLCKILDVSADDILGLND